MKKKLAKNIVLTEHKNGDFDIKFKSLAPAYKRLIQKKGNDLYVNRKIVPHEFLNGKLGDASQVEIIQPKNNGLEFEFTNGKQKFQVLKFDFNSSKPEIFLKLGDFILSKEELIINKENVYNNLKDKYRNFYLPSGITSFIPTNPGRPFVYNISETSFVFHFSRYFFAKSLAKKQNISLSDYTKKLELATELKEYFYFDKKEEILSQLDLHILEKLKKLTCFKKALKYFDHITYPIGTLFQNKTLKSKTFLKNGAAFSFIGFASAIVLLSLVGLNPFTIVSGIVGLSGLEFLAEGFKNRSCSLSKKDIEKINKIIDEEIDYIVKSCDIDLSATTQIESEELTKNPLIENENNDPLYNLYADKMIIEVKQENTKCPQLQSPSEQYNEDEDVKF